MAGVPRPSTVEQGIVICVRHCKKLLTKYVNSLPDQDAYATAHSILVDVINSMDQFLKDFKTSLREAKKEVKRNPDQSTNRARKWCPINDSRRKPSAGSEDAPSPDEETP